jgi:parallel beta-helix repeat protein
MLLSISVTSAEGLTPRDPIYIEGNDNFTPANGVTSGSGTENDPYIIENWDIDAENANGIDIRNTTAHFVIRNCRVRDGWVNQKIGIYFDNVMNGRVENARVENNYYGIVIHGSDNNFIFNNLVENNNEGIFLGGSDNNLIYHNNFLNNATQAYDNGSNFWDNGYPSGGNYWNDYAGADNWRGDRENLLMPGSDGIGDTPYYIPEDNNRDRYPLMSPFPPWTGWAVFGVLYQPPPGPIARICGLEDLYAVRLEKNLVLYRGSRLVMKFYTYEGAYENESVIENFTPPWHVKENEVVPHPGNIGVEKARLDLTYENTENVISTLASWTTRRSDLMSRISEIKLEWPYASPAEWSALIQEISDIKGQWPYAPA